MTSPLYPCILAVLGVMAIYSDVFAYMAKLEMTSISPAYIVGGLAILSIPFIFANREAEPSTDEARFPPRSIMFWIYGYTLITLIWMLPTIHTVEATQELHARVVASVTLVTFCILFSSQRAQVWARNALIGVTLATAACMFIEVYNPLAFLPTGHLRLNVGRSGGFYMNANKAGAALVLGYILTIFYVRPSFRLPYALFLFSAVFLTFSRSSLIGFTLVTAYITYVGGFAQSIRRKGLVGLALTLFVVGLFVSQGFLGVVLENIADNRNVQTRLDWLSSLLYAEASATDDSSLGRLNISRLAWDLFWSSPFVGHGIGTTYQWDEEISTHNMYLLHLVDHGLVGALILPALVLAAIWKTRGEARKTSFAFALFILFNGFFSHNILGSYFYIISFAFVASIVRSSNLEVGDAYQDPDSPPQASEAVSSPIPTGVGETAR